MTIVQWSDEFKTGEKEIDKEHWGLFALINDLGDKVAQGAARDSIGVTIEALVAYVDVHFEHEERLMRETGFPGLDDHLITHKALEQQVDEFKKDFEHDQDKFDFDRLMEFLSNWLSEHILKQDMKFAAFHKKYMANK